MSLRTIIALSFALLVCSGAPAAPLPIDPLWKSEAFRKAFTGSYGIDSRIEPKVTSAEKAVLEAVAAKLAAGDRAGAASTLAGSELLKGSAALIFDLGNLRFEEGKREDAIENFGSALKLYPNFRDAHRNLAVALVQGADFAKAEPHLRRALELGAQDGLTLGLLGYCHSNAGRPQSALQAYRTAALTMPDEPQWRLGEAGALMALDELGAAASIYEEVLQLQPEQVGIWVNLADVRLQQGEPVLAIADLEVARRLGGLGSAELLSLGHLYLNESLPAQAMSTYRAGLGADPPAPFAKAVDAVEYLARFGRWEEAKALAAEVRGNSAYAAAVTADDKPAARFGRALAIIEMKAGDAEAGAALVAEVLRKKPIDGHALMLLADFRHGKGEVDEALMLLEQAVADPAYEARAQRRRGEVLVARRDYAGAVKALRKAQALDPDDTLRDYLESVERLAGMFSRE
jgi:tetratricopeptide (TPR) repeat protein